MTNPMINKVAESGIITINLENWYPSEPIVLFDLKDFLFMELILKEKEFRQSLLVLDWEFFRDKNIAIVCSTDAIIPLWAYMLTTVYLRPVAKYCYMGSVEEMRKDMFIRTIQSIDKEMYRDARVIVKGCGDIELGAYAFVEITKLLQPVVKSLMYGEPCSTVPLYKKK
jgi:hypothetical protein